MKKLIGFVLGLVLIYACNPEYTPKPRGYFRIDFPKHTYQHYTGDVPYHFDYPTYGKVNVYKADSFWINVEYPRFNAKIHVTYHNIKPETAGSYIEETRALAYKHTIKADAIKEKEFYNAQRKVYGILYDIKGNAASSVNFFLTDSTQHFFRGALYFSNTPNKDSLAPVVEFLKADILKMMETFEWN